MMHKKDRTIVRDLAKQYAEIAADPIQDERRELWRRLNSLEATRPLVLVRAGGGVWKETPAVQPTCETPPYRGYEALLRQKLYQDFIGDDHVSEPWIQVNAVRVTPPGPWGPPYTYIHPEEAGGAWQFDPALRELEDVDKLVAPKHVIDEDETAQQRARLEDAIGDILPICVSRAPLWDNNWHSDIITDLTRLRGLTQLMWDMVDNPEWLHSVIAWMSGHIQRVHAEAEEAGDWHLCDHQNQAVSYSRELPDPSPNGEAVTRNQLWTFCAAQEMETVSPAMHEEFLLNYQLPMLREFGLVAYGCCDNLTNKIDMLRKIPNLRRIAVTLAADIARCSEQIQTDYVMSWRPNPAQMICCGFDADLIRRVVREAMDAMRGRAVDITLKEIETVCGRPGDLREWVNVVRSVTS
ncbi:MAG: hypothetical protein HN742_31195 [Lentisphaerae bacterium]|jgi:hypothetical protein|nr:hypothetical protein [Lentisphaerota bacterium]MBT4817750.1 hypothetical protein [Lentisphaerota bacterium]MBT5612030.1 hypothetical protein [Lentisphaerota bacterium]MBT7054778.1 hypothetical protein [Lentisphaerota bacterium]MBT7846377.1 hypothetical protein [Lentisphaerota bacterium]